MTLKDIAAISGKPGLYRILKPTRTGVIVESMDEKATKMVVHASQRVSILKEISVYITGGEEESVKLSDVFAVFLAKYPQGIQVNTSDGTALTAILEEAMPNYDKDKVYQSDIKKMVTWFNTILRLYPEVLNQPEEEEKATEAATTSAQDAE